MIIPKTYTLYKKLYQAYFSARKQKRNKDSQLKFEVDYEQGINDLYNDIVHFRYKLLPPNVFVTRHPVVREIFAPQFRDRIIHHLIYNYIYKHLDRKFIYDSYSCRLNKGTSFGVKRAARFMRRVSNNYTQDAYILKLDIQGYFMQMNRRILHDKVNEMINYKALKITNTEQKYLKYLIETVIMYDAAENPKICSPVKYWDQVPNSKSLFHTPKGCGLPIGSLTSQLFSNVYLNDLDHFIKSELKMKYYGRYVDDMLFMHQDKEYLQSIIAKVNAKLEEVGLSLHPRKIRLQHYTKGVEFLGRYILPGRIYLSNRCKKQVKSFVERFTAQWENAEVYIWDIINPINSYLGLLSEDNTHNFKKRVLADLPKDIFTYYRLVENGKLHKIELREDYNPKNKYAQLFACL